MYPENPQHESVQPVPPQTFGAGPTPTAATRSRKPLLIGVVAAVVIVVAAASAFVTLRAGNVGPFKDSGLAMCETIRDDKGKTTSNDNEKMTEASYLKLRKPFANSRYSDIRDSGTKFVDLVWQFAGATQKGGNEDGALGMALVMGGQLMQSYSSLSGACANHGVTIPPLSQN